MSALGDIFVQAVVRCNTRNFCKQGPTQLNRDINEYGEWCVETKIIHDHPLGGTEWIPLVTSCDEVQPTKTRFVGGIVVQTNVQSL